MIPPDVKNVEMSSGQGSGLEADSVNLQRGIQHKTGKSSVYPRDRNSGRVLEICEGERYHKRAFIRCGSLRIVRHSLSLADGEKGRRQFH